MPFGYHGKAGTLNRKLHSPRDTSGIVGHPEVNRLFPDTQ